MNSWTPYQCPRIAWCSVGSPTNTCWNWIFNLKYKTVYHFSSKNGFILEQQRIANCDTRATANPSQVQRAEETLSHRKGVLGVPVAAHWLSCDSFSLAGMLGESRMLKPFSCWVVIQLNSVVSISFSGL